VARDATARLYDVDDSSVKYTKPKKRGRYDRGTITFRAVKGKLIDLDKLHESIWATRLSGGTRSGCVRLDVTAVGKVKIVGGKTILHVAGSDRTFLLAEDPKSKKRNSSPFRKLRAAVADGNMEVSVTGRVDGWHGRWPAMLRKKEKKPRTILVTSFEIHSKEG